MNKDPVPGWTPPPLPQRVPLAGRFVRLEPFSPEHAGGLFEAFAEDATDEMWRYLPTGPFADLAAYRAWFDAARVQHDPLHFAVRMGEGRLGGSLSLMRINPQAGSVEAGWLTYAPRLQRRPETTETMYLLMRWAFDAGYRRFEWKCDAANMPSRAAAERFGMSYEGTFRQATVVKGLNRDTAWFAAIDKDWPTLRAAFEEWLAPGSFEADGRQKRSLRDLTAPLLVTRDPVLAG